MPRDDFPHLDRFLHGVRRRLMLIRLLERVGIATAIACAVAVSLIGLLAWRGDEAFVPTLVCMGLGVLGGVAWGITRIPTALEAAIEADLQLPWSDLLSTALFLRQGAADEWTDALLGDANQRCEGLSVSSILLQRLSRRAWSGIALALTIVMSLSAWVGAPGNSQAREETAVTRQSVANKANLERQPLLTPPALPDPRPSDAPADGQDSVADASSPTVPDQKDGTVPNEQTDPAGQDSAANDGRGGTIGRSKPAPNAQSILRNSAAKGTSPTSIGKTAGGNSAAMDSKAGQTGTTGGTVTRSTGGNSSTPPWRSSDWQREVDTAQQALSSGTIPAPDRDLVRDYFQRE